MDGLRGAFKRKGGLFDNENQVRGKAANKPDDINPEEPREKKGTESSSKTQKDDVPTDQGGPSEAALRLKPDDIPKEQWEEMRLRAREQLQQYERAGIQMDTIYHQLWPGVDKGQLRRTWLAGSVIDASSGKKSALPSMSSHEARKDSPDRACMPFILARFSQALYAWHASIGVATCANNGSSINGND